MNSEIMPWVDEIESYVKTGNKKIGEIKKLLKSSDLNYSMLDLEKLTVLFDNNCKISCEVLERELDLYFALLKDKGMAGIDIPTFNSYVDSLYSQDINSLRDQVFKIMVSKLLKSQVEKLPDSLNDFIYRLPKAYESHLDIISNDRLGTLISALQGMNLPYSQMPNECKKFVRNLFAACAVKTEIADNNRDSFCRYFRNSPQYYYSIFNKAFAGVDQFESWIDEPAKKITLGNMVRYANYQNAFLENRPNSFNYYNFQGLVGSNGFNRRDTNSGYLKENREYKSFANKSKDLFVDMINSELCEYSRSLKNGKPDFSALDELALTNKMQKRMKFYKDKNVSTMVVSLGDYLVDLVHLDELTGKSFNQLIDIQKIIDAHNRPEKTVEVPQVAEIAEQPQTAEKQAEVVNPAEEKSQNQNSYYCEFEEVEEDIFDKIRNNACTPSDLPELYELAEKDPDNWEIHSIIHDLEVQEKELKED